MNRTFWQATISQAAAVVMLGTGTTVADARPKFDTPAFVTAPVNLPQAEAIANRTEAVWTTMDAAQIKALYSTTIVGFDVAAPGLSTTKANWDTLQDAYAALKIDGSLRKARTIQLIDGDAFVVSGWWHITSSSVPANSTDIRCTDVYRRTASKWLIVNEHCSVPLKS